MYLLVWACRQWTFAKDCHFAFHCLCYLRLLNKVMLWLCLFCTWYWCILWNITEEIIYQEWFRLKSWQGKGAEEAGRKQSIEMSSINNWKSIVRTFSVTRTSRHLLTQWNLKISQTCLQGPSIWHSYTPYRGLLLTTFLLPLYFGYLRIYC